MPKPPSRTAETARLADGERLAHDEVTQPWPGRHVSVGGVDIFIRHTPPLNEDAEPALFVHGLGGAALNWTDFAGLLRNDLDIEAIDLPGFGRSGPPHDDDYALNTHARAVIDYLDQSKRGPVHLVGNSMGGAISILVAARRPDLVRTLTLISPAVPDLRMRVHPLRSDWRMGLLIVPVLGGVAMRKLGAAPVEQRVKGTIALCFADPSRYPKRRLAEAVEESRARLAMPWASAAMLRSTRGLVRSQFGQRRRAWATMRTIEAPTLVLWGDQDRLVAADLAPYVAAAIPDSRLLVLEDIGHTAMMEDPLTSARALLGLLDDVAATAIS